MKERYKLAKNQGLNWKALVIEDLTDWVKITTRNMLIDGKSYSEVQAVVSRKVKDEILEFENAELKERTFNGMIQLSKRVYAYLYRTFYGVGWALIGAIANVSAYYSRKTPLNAPRTKKNANGEYLVKIEQDKRLIGYFMDTKGIYKHAVPITTFAKEYMDRVNHELGFLNEIEAKDVYGERISLRNIAEMTVRHDRQVENLLQLKRDGVRLVYIVPHANCSERCEPWQGKVYSLDGSSGITKKGVPYEPLEHATDIYYTTKAGRTYKNGCVSGFNCFSSDTKVLTDKGWLYFNELSGDEKFFTLNTKTKQPEWQKAKNYFKQWYNGEMIHAFSYTGDLLVTPNHNMLYYTDKVRKLRFKEAKDLSVYDKIYCGVEWSKRRKSNTVKVGDKEVDLKLYCRLLAYYLADGSIHAKSSGISVAQQNNDAMYNELKQLPFLVWRDKNRIIVRDKALRSDFERLGHSDTKYVPQWVKELPKEYLAEFLDAFVKTDGYASKPHELRGKYSSIHKSVFTTSKQLCADLCEIILKCGYRPSICVQKNKGKTQLFKNGYYTMNYDLYCIGINKHTVYRNKKIERVQYNDYVYCVEVGNHTLLVQRRGKIQWCGNCRHTLKPYYDDTVIQEIPAKVVETERKINKTQRYLERKVRKYRSNALQYKGIDDRIYAISKRKAEESNKEYVRFSKQNRVPYYPSRTKVLDKEEID